MLIHVSKFENNNYAGRQSKSESDLKFKDMTTMLIGILYINKKLAILK